MTDQMFPYEPPSLTDYSELELMKVNAHSLDRMDYTLERIALFLETLTQAKPTTEQPPADATAEPVTQIRPTSEIPTAADPENVTLPDGRTVPTKVIQALTVYEEATWPGALLPEARASVASVVLQTVKQFEIPVLRTNYPFCLDNPADVITDSPCIKRADHNGKHQDNNDGTW